MPYEMLGHMLGKEKRQFMNRPSQEWILPDTTLGVEIEIENVQVKNLPKILSPEVQLYWAWHTDDSLHNAGCEFSFRNPMYGEDISLALKAILAVCKEQNYLCSLRTGIHVHVDARDLSRAQLIGILAYYMVYEPAIYSWVATTEFGKTRHANNFCLPWYKFEGAIVQARDILHSFSNFDKGATTQDCVQTCESFHKYAGLNLKSLATFGSIEFRQLETCLDYDRIKDWINIILSLKRSAMQVPESSLTIIREIEYHGIEKIAERMFGNRIKNQMWQGNAGLTKEILENSIPNAMAFITEVLNGATPIPMIWEMDAAIKESEVKKDHPGFLAWRASNYPKDLQPAKEEAPLLKVKGKKYNPFMYNIQQANDWIMPAPPQMSFSAGDFPAPPDLNLSEELDEDPDLAHQQLKVNPILYAHYKTYVSPHLSFDQYISQRYGC